jgi:hypothetical protein
MFMKIRKAPSFLPRIPVLELRPPTGSCMKDQILNQSLTSDISLISQVPAFLVFGFCPQTEEKI